MNSENEFSCPLNGSSTVRVWEKKISKQPYPDIKKYGDTRRNPGDI